MKEFLFDPSSLTLDRALPTWRRLLAIARQPIAADTRAALARAWDRLPPSLRTANQFLGRQYAGCGATIGAMPRCDFACTGCYLGDGANRVPALPLADLYAQLDRLREWLGEGGNLQLTDGEITLRAPDELVALIRHARAIGLVPMVFTHGDTFRRHPGLLERLMREGGLRELSLHIDTTMRGRRGIGDAAGADPQRTLRDELAGLIGAARDTTGLPLDVATTFTVTADNLGAVPAVVGWLLDHPGVFKMISFQPVAQVGRTAAGLGGGATVEGLWQAIGDGLRVDPSTLARQQQWLGHPACSRFVQGVVVTRAGAPPRFVVLTELDQPDDRAAVDAAMGAFGGATTRNDAPREAQVRSLALLLRQPRVLLRHALPWLWRLARRLDRRPGRLLADLLRGRARVDYLNLVSHHFMSAAELPTPLGRERLAVCVFKVAIDGELVSMCDANAGGRRAELYARMAQSPQMTQMSQMGSEPAVG
jgi:hypothetical protein